MAKEHGELLRTFNTYLNQQEKKAVAPESDATRRIVLQEQDYHLKMGDKQQQDKETYLNFQLTEKDEDEVALEGQDLLEKLHKIRPESLSDEERYKKMKNILKAVKKEGIENGMMSIDDMTEWAMSTAVIDGASGDFLDIVNAMKGIGEVFRERETAWKKYEELLDKKDAKQAVDNELEEARLAHNIAANNCYEKYFALAESARKYIDTHDGFKWSSKGSKRLAFAKHILSSRFVEQYVVKLRKSDLKSTYDGYSENLDGPAFILAYRLRKDTLKMQAAIRDDVFDENNQVKEKYDGFTMESVNRTPSRVLYDPATMLSSEEGMEAERKKVTYAMEAYAGIKVTGLDKDGKTKVKKFVDKEPMFTILDGIVDEVCKYKITKEMFQKDYYIKHPYEMLKLRQFSTILGDCLDENGHTALGGDCGKEYLESLKGDASYTKFYAKLTLMTHLWISIISFMNVGACFQTESIVLRTALHPEDTLAHDQFLGVPSQEASEDEYEDLQKSPEDWMTKTLEAAKRDGAATKAMKQYMDSSLFSSIKVPKRKKGK